MPLLPGDQAKLRSLLTEAVTLICQSGLRYENALKIEGLLGVTLDDTDLFIVNINERVKSDAVRSSHLKITGVTQTRKHEHEHAKSTLQDDGMQGQDDGEEEEAVQVDPILLNFNKWIKSKNLLNEDGKEPSREPCGLSEVSDLPSVSDFEEGGKQSDTTLISVSNGQDDSEVNNALYKCQVSISKFNSF